MKKKIVFIIIISVVLIMFTGCTSSYMCFGTDENGETIEWEMISVGDTGYGTEEAIGLRGRYSIDYTTKFGLTTNKYEYSLVRQYFTDKFYPKYFSDYEKAAMVSRFDVYGYGLTDKVLAPMLDDLMYPTAASLDEFWMSDGEDDDPDNARVGGAVGEGIYTKFAPITNEYKLLPVCYVGFESIVAIVRSPEDALYSELLGKLVYPSDAHNLWKLILIDSSIPAFNYTSNSLSVFVGSDLVLEEITLPEQDYFIRCVVGYSHDLSDILLDYGVMQYGVMEYDSAEQTASIDISPLKVGTHALSFWYEDDLGTNYNTNICEEMFTINVNIINKPIITLSEADSITFDSARLSMSVTNTSSEQITKTGLEVSANADFSSGSIIWETENVLGEDLESTSSPLLPGTLYYYRAYAENNAGRVYSGTKTFTTYREKYSITVSSGSNGSISPSSTEVEFGQSQTFKITPSSGYKVSDVIVDGASVGAISSYTFSNVMEDHNISASFAKIPKTVTATPAATYAAGNTSSNTTATPSIPPSATDVPTETSTPTSEVAATTSDSVPTVTVSNIIDGDNDGNASTDTMEENT